ncbi:hypothetical protein N0V93_008881 [Gnomoniopsis smithogilvyi]|uniref:FAD-binding domain-containing protein n=1 Tax=Gnomoniopsis smithogilvyi TaxID=1191159 RepID=A0A9W9CS68_9PEZI|nr:hypothetical protein N0V93_008881 [Gnomoniopsis smithogilvyi]
MNASRVRRLGVSNAKCYIKTPAISLLAIPPLATVHVFGSFPWPTFSNSFAARPGAFQNTLAVATFEHPVLIVGAGVAGLTLAQGLRLTSITFRIFERHAQSHVKQGHRFRISKEGQAALDTVLSPRLQQLLRRTAPEKQTFAPRYVDARQLDFGKPEPVDPAESGMPLDRTWLRMLLSIGLQDMITYDKQFDSYKVEDDGLVLVRFSDGSFARGQLLVGADGIKSRVREHLQPDRKLLDLERWIMWGRTPVTDELMAKLDSTDILSWCMCLDHVLLLYTASTLDANVQTVIEQRLVHLESEGALPDFSDYVYWAVCTAPWQFAPQLPRTVQEKERYLKALSETWHPTLKYLLASATHELSACVPILSSKPDIQIGRSPGAAGRVMLIGDAAHAMSPMGGSGGDTAIRDAAELACMLSGECSVEKIVEAFEERMADRAKDKIEHSFRGGQTFWRGKAWNLYSEVEA